MDHRRSDNFSRAMPTHEYNMHVHKPRYIVHGFLEHRVINAVHLSTAVNDSLHDRLKQMQIRRPIRRANIQRTV